MDEFSEKENKEKDSKQDEQIEINKDSAVTRKILFCLCYLWGILFFIPLILYKDDVAKMRANDGLILLLLSIIGNVVFGILTRISVIFGWIAGAYSLVLLLLGIVGIVYVVTDKNEPLPIVGKIKLIK